MRSFPFVYILVFIVFYLLISFGCYINLKKIIPHSYFRIIKFFLGGITFLITFIFILLFVFPFSPRQSTNYIPYFYLNTILLFDLFFKLPLAFSLIIGVLKASWSKTAAYAGLILGLAVLAVQLFGTFAGSQMVRVRKIELKFDNLPNEFDNTHIVQISDLHIGSFSKSSNLPEKTIQIINDLSPDLILFTGDMFNNFASEMKGWETRLKFKRSELANFSILGNHDYGNYHDWENDSSKKINFEKIKDWHKTIGFEMLSNENRILRKGKDSIFIIGVENWGHPPFPKYANLEKAISGIPEVAFKILLTHDPAHWEEQIKDKKHIELTLSGHTHGMQWGILVAGTRFSLAGIVRKYWGGLYSDGNSYLYVNTGIGTVAIPWRIEMAPEITSITLKRSKVD